MGTIPMSMLYSIRRAMLGPCLGHIRTMFWIFLQVEGGPLQVHVPVLEGGGPEGE